MGLKQIAHNSIIPNELTVVLGDKLVNYLMLFRHIPKPLQDARLRTTKRIMIKAHFFINGHSLKNRCYDGHVLVSSPRKASLETFYTALLISTVE